MTQHNANSTATTQQRLPVALEVPQDTTVSICHGKATKKTE